MLTATAFTSKDSIHWIASLFGAALGSAGTYIITQCMFLYVPVTYPKYAASLLSMNGLARAVLAAAAVLFAPPLFRGLGVAGGVSLLAALCMVCYLGLFVLYCFGPRLRARSRFAG